MSIPISYRDLKGYHRRCPHVPVVYPAMHLVEQQPLIPRETTPAALSTSTSTFLAARIQTARGFVIAAILAK